MQTVTADDQKRVQIPDAKPGQLFAYETSAGVITLTPVKKAESGVVYAKLARKDGNLSFELPEGYAMPEDAIGSALREERDAQAERGHRP